jgi:hypothetical protein
MVFPAETEVNFISGLQDSFVDPLSVYKSAVLPLARQPYGALRFEGKNRMLPRELRVVNNELVLILRSPHPKTIRGDVKRLAFVGTVEPEQARLREREIERVAFDTEIVGNGSATPSASRHAQPRIRLG